MFYLLLQHRQTIKQGIDYIPKTFQNHVNMIWVSPNTGYPMSLWFISVSIKLVLSDKEATMIQDHLDVHSKLLALFRWIFSESGLSGLAFCCILLLHNLGNNFRTCWNIGALEHVFFPFSWECRNPNCRTPSFFRGVGLNHQPGWNIDELICGGFSAKDTKAHPYVFSTRKAAKTACKEAGYHGLCSKSQGSGGGFFTIRLFCVVLTMINVNVI
jgi:hypothetical protein